MNAKIGIGTIILAIIIGTLVGPISSLGQVTTANLTDATFWLDELSATIRSFASVAVAGLGLLAGAYGIPVLRSPKENEPPA